MSHIYYHDGYAGFFDEFFGLEPNRIYSSAPLRFAVDNGDRRTALEKALDEHFYATPSTPPGN